MIFACAGSRPYQFNRLFEELDRLVAAGEVDGEVFAQIGSSTYEPESFPFEHFMEPDDFKAAEERADIVISHGASGSIMGALNAGKKVIAVARLARYGEHINDHQVAINETLANEGLVLNVTDMADLGPAIRALQSGEVELRPWRNDNPTAIVDAIDEFIQESFHGIR
ncbi:glycosyl transferase [Collinsella tanakaei]|nr:glycosyl transferase [Collinsella tanakaei]